MRQARLNSPLRTREEALRQFAEVEAYLAKHNLPPPRPGNSPAPRRLPQILQEKQLLSEEPRAVFDELLALREDRVTG
jgi:hypothetical protein